MTSSSATSKLGESIKYSISIDTSIFDKCGHNYTTGLLSKFEQFHDLDDILIVSEVVQFEVLSHIKEKLTELERSLDKIVRGSRGLFSESLNIDDNLKRTLLPSYGASEHEHITWDRFVLNTNATIIPASYTDIRVVLDKYFELEPPFSSKKKFEFPDAIALLSLESWAQQNSRRLLAVSTDTDWKSFCDNSDHMEYHEDLASALHKLLESNTGSDVPTLIKCVKDSLPSHVDALRQLIPFYDFDWDDKIEAHSAYYYEFDSVEIELRHIELNLDDDDSVAVVEMGDGYASVEVSATLFFFASANFQIYLEDWQDKQYISMGDTTKHIEFHYNARLLISFGHSVKEGAFSLEIDTVAISAPPTSIDFGHIEYDDGDPTHEKY